MREVFLVIRAKIYTYSSLSLEISVAAVVHVGRDNKNMENKFCTN